jgi:hypothetical protein
MGWTGDLVYADMRRTDYGVNACWLHARTSDAVTVERLVRPP